MDSYPDLWTWTAFYQDGSFLEEYGETQSHGFSEVDQTRLLSFVLSPTVPGLSTHHVQIPPGSDLRVLFFRRRTLEVGPNPPGPDHKKTVHCLGWQKTVQGVQVSSYTFIFEDGSVLVTDDFQAV